MCSLYLCSKMFSRLLINSSCNGIFLRWSAADLMCWNPTLLDRSPTSWTRLQRARVARQSPEKFRDRGGWRIGNTPHIWTPLPILPLTQPTTRLTFLSGFSSRPLLHCNTTTRADGQGPRGATPWSTMLPII